MARPCYGPPRQRVMPSGAQRPRGGLLHPVRCDADAPGSAGAYLAVRIGVLR